MKFELIKKIFFNKPIRTELNLFFLTLVIVPLIATGILASNIINDILISQTEARSIQNIAQSVQAMDMSLEELNNIIIASVWNQSLQDILRTNSAEENSRESNTSFVEEKLRSIANTRRDIEFLMISTKDERNYSFSTSNISDNYISYVTLLDPAIYSSSSFQRGEITWLGFRDGSNNILGVRKLMDFDTLEDLGYLYVVIKEDTIKQKYDSLKTTSGSFFVVKDALGNEISNNCPLDVDAATIDLTSNKNSTMKKEQYSGNEYYLTSRESGYSNWIISQLTPTKELTREISRIQMTIFAVIMMIMSILFLFMSWFSNYLIHPISEMRDLMKEIRLENFNIHADESRNDEMGQLAKSFNAMASKIKRLIEEDYKSKILLQETEYSFLRAQINPHFLYNTLDSISWLASMDGNKKISRISVALGRILRWSISNTGNVVPLKDEVSNLEDYLTIQKLRYGDNLNYQIHIDEELLQLTVPKMILQPLVENSLIHGLEEINGEKKLTITAQRMENHLNIIIKDNGVGMTQDRIKEVLADKIQNTSATYHGVGVYNVYKRIQMMYGEKYGLEIISEPGLGTQVIIKIPVEKQEED